MFGLRQLVRTTPFSTRARTAPYLSSFSSPFLRHVSSSSSSSTPGSGEGKAKETTTEPGSEPKLQPGEQAIFDKLHSRFSPTQLMVQDVSGGCGTFYAILIASKDFQGLSVVKQHRLVTEELKREIQGIHGLQIKTLAE